MNDEEYSDSTDFSSFITTADLIVTETLANSGLSDARKKQIELYLAAHFAALTKERGQVTFSKNGEASEYYGFKSTEGLGLTRYGMQAVALDTSGILADATNPKPKAQFQLIAFKDDPKNGSCW
jgi:hypothetical protein